MPIAPGTIVLRNAFDEDGYVHVECAGAVEKAAALPARMRPPPPTKTRVCHYCRAVLAASAVGLVCDACKERFQLPISSRGGKP